MEVLARGEVRNQIVKPWKGFAKHCAQHFSLSDERRLQHRDSLEVNSLS